LPTKFELAGATHVSRAFKNEKKAMGPSRGIKTEINGHGSEPRPKLSRRIPGGQTMDMHERQEDDGSQSEQRRSFEMSNWIQWLKKRVLLLEQIITRYDHSEESHQPIKTCECFGM
jgi:hypothetical protein